VNPLLMHELARVEHASRVASLSAHRHSALMELLRRRRAQPPVADAEAAAAVEFIGRPVWDQAQSSAASEKPAAMTPLWAD
jgi:hypothetical protein